MPELTLLIAVGNPANFLKNRILIVSAAIKNRISSFLRAPHYEALQYALPILRSKDKSGPLA